MTSPVPPEDLPPDDPCLPREARARRRGGDGGLAGGQATAWEVAYATVWLLSSEASCVNAYPLVLDGGATGFI